MSFSYDLATDIGRVRLLVPDRVPDDAVFTDQEITALLDVEGSNVRRAAALALETIASDEAYVQKTIRTLDLQTNGAATAKALMDRAMKLRDLADRDDDVDGPAFDWAPMVLNPETAREQLIGEFLRG